MNNNYCCDNFEWLLNDSGKRGINILPISIGNENGFCLQSRSEDFHDLNSGMIVEHRINYCPWCGTDLSQIISKIDFGFLIKEKSKYLLDPL